MKAHSTTRPSFGIENESALDMYTTARSIREENEGGLTPINNAFRTIHHNESQPAYFGQN
jgi:hypothetical protein